MPKLDVVIPAHNESDNIIELLVRLERALFNAGIKYNIFVVDNRSSDGTDERVKEYINSSNSSSIKLLYKKDKQGKAYAILEGTHYGKAPYIAMIDGDLQYPPEVLPEMFKLVKKFGVVVANRKKNGAGFLRKIGTRLNRYIFEKKLLGLNCDTQSGLKVFKREIIRYLHEADVKPWSIDMPLLVTARRLGYKIATVDIEFAKRKSGLSKVSFLKTGFQIATTAISLKLSEKKPFKVLPKNERSPIGAGVVYKGRRFTTHTNLPFSETALKTLNIRQKLLLGAVVLLLTAGLFINAKGTVIILIALLSALYFLDFIFTTFILLRSLSKNIEIKFSKKSLGQLNDKSLPKYSILCPLYKEANVLPDFVKAINNLDWPKDKLDVILLLEENDKETQKAAENLSDQSHFRVLVVPHSLPKTKPKACNYGLAFAKGEYVVVYDAEDRPDPMQLKKAYIGFKRSASKVVCLQSKLNYYNPDQNFLTKLFTAEYSLWFDLILPGLQSVKTIIPLGGTSNHFKLFVLRDLGGWDAFNVTEDCELGTRLFRKGFTTAIIDSTTYEEANSKVKSWLKQRSRWIKGYLQTYFVHTRHPLSFVVDHGVQAFIFQLVIGMRMIFIMINPILWLVTISYFMFRPTLGLTIESLYPTPIFYMAVFPMIFGNFLYLYNYMIALAKREKWYLIKYVYLVPFYWVMVSFASFIALYQLIVKPHYWEKTEHGFHLAPKKKESKSPGLAISLSIPSLQESFFDSVRNLLKKENFALGAILLIISSGLVNFIDFLYNAYLGRKLEIVEFGNVALLGNFITIAGILTSALMRVTTHKASYFFGKHNAPAKEFWRRIKKWVWFGSLAATFVWVISIPSLGNYFNIGGLMQFVLFTPFWTVGFLAGLNIGFLGGNFKFSVIALISFVEVLTKLLIAVVTVEMGYPSLVYISLPISVVIAFFISYIVISRMQDAKDYKDKESDLTFPRGFFLASLLTNVSIVAFLSIDVVLAKHYLSPVEAGNYALLSLSGKIIYFLGGLFIQFVNPLISRQEGQGRVSRRTFYLLFISSSTVSLMGYVGIGLFGKVTMPLLFGDKANAILPILPLYGLGIAAYSIASFFTIYHQVRKHYIFSVLAILVSAAQIFYIALFHSSTEMIAMVTTLTGIGFLIYSIILHLSYKQLTSISNNILDFFDLFGPSAPISSDKIKILIFNWRDVKHVWAGGSEIYIHEIAKRWVRKGHQVTLFCGNDGKNKREEKVAGVKVIRRGGFYTVYLWAFLYYIFRFRKKFGVVID